MSHDNDFLDVYASVEELDYYYSATWLGQGNIGNKRKGTIYIMHILVGDVFNIPEANPRMQLCILES